MPENVEKAKEEIEAHIAVRTGSQQTNVDDDFRNNGTEVGSPLTNPEYVEAAISAPFPSRYVGKKAGDETFCVIFKLLKLFKLLCLQFFVADVQYSQQKCIAIQCSKLLSY